MAGMRAIHKKQKVTFEFTGDLKEVVEKAEKELKEKDGTTKQLFFGMAVRKCKKSIGNI